MIISERIFCVMEQKSITVFPTNHEKGKMTGIS